MKNFCFSAFIASLIVLLPTADVQGIGIDLGPFSIQLFPNDAGIPVRVETISDPICYAIETQRQLEMTVEMKEDISNKEFKFITKKIIVEPYLFGFGNQGQPVLQGNITSEKLIKEVTVKYGEDEKNIKNNQENFYTGQYMSQKEKKKVTMINLSKVADLHVLRDTHFVAPKTLEIDRSKLSTVVCQIEVQ